MEYEINFKCISDNLEEIPEKIVKETGVNFPNVHLDSKQMAVLAKAMKDYHGDNITTVPFCLTVEAEALGADIKMGDEKIGPRVGNYVFNSIEDLEKISLIDLSKERISEVLKAVDILKNDDETVALTVQGPFAIMSCLIDPRLFFKAVKKDKLSVDRFMETICDSIVMYIEEGVKRGAKIISFSDSTGTIDVLGPRMYKEYSGRYAYNILKKVENRLGNSILHICGVTSMSMYKAGLLKLIPIEVEKDITYGDALSKIIEEKSDVRIIGHYCLKKTSLKMRKPIVWKIELN